MKKDLEVSKIRSIFAFEMIQETLLSLDELQSQPCTSSGVLPAFCKNGVL